MNKKSIDNWFTERDFDLFECKFRYLKEDQEVFLNYEEVIAAVLDRMSAERLIQIFNGIEKYYKEDWYDRKNGDVGQATLNEVSRFLQDMANYKVFEDFRFFTFAQLAKDYNMSEEFLKWWMQENDLNEQQILCDHDDSDQFAEDGVWYNSVGTCIRCRVRMDKTLDHSDSIALVYKAWQRK